MSPEKTKILFEKFSDLYTGRNLSIRENLMPFGFECGNGWFDLLYRLSEDISKLQPSCRAVQVKEKFGTLRFYTGPLSDKVDERINKAENESAVTCETCGKPGNMHFKGGWMATLCPLCGKKDGYISDDELPGDDQ